MEYDTIQFNMLTITIYTKLLNTLVKSQIVDTDTHTPKYLLHKTIIVRK